MMHKFEEFVVDDRKRKATKVLSGKDGENLQRREALDEIFAKQFIGGNLSNNPSLKISGRYEE